VKLLICVFEPSFGLKINFHKAKSSALDRQNNLSWNIQDSFVARREHTPYRKLSYNDWKFIEDRFEKILSGWKGKLATVGSKQIGFDQLGPIEFTDVHDVLL
jgi:hypothetical protein